MKALVLAAGEGRRLWPLTQTLPKPLAPICGRPCIEVLLEGLAAAGLTRIGINTHWLPEALHRYLGDGSRWGVELTWRHEPELLDGCGTLKAFADFLGDEPALVLNGDIVHDFDLTAIVAAHQASGAPLTLVTTPRHGPLLHPVTWDEAGRLRGIRRTGLDDRAGVNVGVFTGAQIVEPVIWREFIPPGRPYHLARDLAPDLLRRGVPIQCHPVADLWVDVGSLPALGRAHAAVLAARLPQYLRRGREFAPGVWAEGLTVVEGRLIPPVYLGRGAVVEAGAVVGPFAAVGAWAVVPAGQWWRCGLVGLGADAATVSAACEAPAGPAYYPRGDDGRSR